MRGEIYSGQRITFVRQLKHIISMVVRATLSLGGGCGDHGKQSPEVEPPAEGGVVWESMASSALKSSPRREEA